MANYNKQYKEREEALLVYARKGTMPEESLTVIESAFLLGMINLYGNYKAGRIDLKTARKVKNDMCNDFELKRNFEDIYRQHIKMRGAIGNLSKTVETGDCEICKRLMRIFDGREDCQR